MYNSRILTSRYTHINKNLSRYRTFPSPWRVFTLLFAIGLQTSLTTTGLISITYISFELHINEVTQWVSVFFHAVGCLWDTSMLLLSHTPVYETYKSFLPILLWWAFGFFPVWGSYKQASMNIHIHVFLWTDWIGIFISPQGNS